MKRLWQSDPIPKKSLIARKGISPKNESNPEPQFHGHFLIYDDSQ